MMIMNLVKLAFHDADTDTRHPRRHPREDRRKNVGVSFSLPQEYVSDVSARILTRKSASVWASWNAGFTEVVDLSLAIAVAQQSS